MVLTGPNTTEFLASSALLPLLCQAQSTSAGPEIRIASAAARHAGCAGTNDTSMSALAEMEAALGTERMPGKAAGLSKRSFVFE